MTLQRYDLRDERVPLSPKVRMLGSGKPMVRDPSAITGVTVHQMAANFGVSKAQLTAARGDRSLALARRALSIACHAAAFRSGESVLAAPCLWYVQHGNQLNPSTLGLEIDGRHPGLDDDPSTAPLREDLGTTWGGEPCELTDELVTAARDACTWLIEEARTLGCDLRYVYAHRQSSDSRRSDPGQRLWRAVVLEHAVPRLGLRVEAARVWGDGRPVPRAWDPAGVGAY